MTPRRLQPFSLGPFAAFALLLPMLGTRGNTPPRAATPAATPRPPDPILTEFVADNDGSFLDGFGEPSDWIEVFNPGTTDLDLFGWSLRDASTRWTFPRRILPAGGFLIVFASDRRLSSSVDPGGHLHASFKLDAEGESPSLLRPDGTTAFAFPDPGLQPRGRSFGLPQTTIALCTFDSPARLDIPMQPTSDAWRADAAFDDTGWIEGQASAGYGAPFSAQGTVAYRVAAGTPGNQDYPGSLGMDFVVNQPVLVTDLGCFDDLGDGLRSTIRVQLWRRRDAGTPATFSDDSGEAVLASMTFATGDPGTLVEGNRFKPLPAPLELSPGAYTIVASGYGATERNGNLGAGSPGEPWETRSGGGRIAFVGSARYGTAGSFPRTVDGGPANRYAAGTFRFAGSDDLRPRTSIPAASRTGNPAARMRVRFEAPDPRLAGFDALRLRLAYDDGCVAWLNGVEVARRHAPNPLGHADAATTVTNGVEFLPLAADRLVPGTNLIAVQGLNASTDDTDFLMAVELVGIRTRRDAARFFATPTPGAPNPGEGVAGYTSPPNFETRRGFFEAPFDLRLASPTPNATIRFTRDGSAPSATRGTVYDGPLRIETSSVIRAIALRDGWEPSTIATHTYLFPRDVAVQPASAPPGYPTSWAGSGTSVTADYGMIDPTTQPARYARAAGNAAFGPEAARDAIAASLRALPVLSVSTAPANLFDAATGIYLHPGSRGEAWEKPVAVECFTADGSESWHADAGMHVMGLTSRSLEVTPKLNLMLVFSRDYGDTWLREPFFGPDGPERIKRIALRSNTRDGWLAEFNGFGTATYILDGFAKDAARDSDEPATRHRYAHLFLNGLYWGVYNPTERPQAHWAETTFGGEDEDYDVIDLCCGNQLESGTFEAWHALLAAAGSGFADDAAYQRVQGNDPNGARNPALPRLLGVDSFIGFALNGYYHASVDWPGNFFVVRDAKADRTEGWRFVTWDTDLGFQGFQVGANKVTPPEGFTHPWWQSSPGVVDVALRKNLDYRLRFADRVHREFFATSGAYRTEANLARWRRLRDAIRPGLYAESARWGDYRPGGLRTVQEHWLPRVDGSAATTWFARRNDTVIRQLRSVGLYPDLDAPAFSPPEGLLPAGNRIAVSHPNAAGTVVYTLDGSDPRRSPEARVYVEPFPIPGPVRLRARVRNGTSWSALHEAAFYPPGNLEALRVTELMHHPPDSGGPDSDDLEFVELRNEGNYVLDLSGHAFRQGIAFAFPEAFLIPPGAFRVLARNAEVYKARHPDAPLHGLFQGRLENGGETLDLANPSGDVVFSFAYDDRSPWPTEASGSGWSLQRQPGTEGLPVSKAWVAATPTPGAPLGADDRDSDFDGMSDGWERRFGFDPAVADAEADADGDGRSNGQEFRASTDPRDAADDLRLRVLDVGGAVGPREVVL
ncbi:MAG: lamin tail domain-containing protein, partial [Verrucomicrobiales bacterium]|nr:lamin tail domain-containing protein [Verrucomicrobiales bacterium]